MMIQGYYSHTMSYLDSTLNPIQLLVISLFIVLDKSISNKMSQIIYDATTIGLDAFYCIPLFSNISA